MHFFEVDHDGNIRYGINGRLELGRGGDGCHYRIEVDKTNPPKKNGNLYVQGTYSKETVEDQTILVLRGSNCDQDGNSALVIFKNETDKATCFVRAGSPDHVLAVEDNDDDGFRVLVLEMEQGDILEIKNGRPEFMVSYNINLAPQIERQVQALS
jgi:hypothetical protein